MPPKKSAPSFCIPMKPIRGKLPTSILDDSKNSPCLRLRDDLGVTRPVLLDALDGACHRAYGSMPNMTWIFNRAGVPVYKSTWTDVNSVRNALEYFLDMVQRRRDREKLVPFYVQRLDYRTKDEAGFYAGLARNGPKAVREFEESGF